MAWKTYRELKPGGRYLRRLGVGAGTDVDPDELREAENEAAVFIDTQLSKTFSTSATPPIIRSLAELLASAIFIEYAAFEINWGDTEDPPRKARALRRAAGDVIEALRAHEIGVQNADGTWDSDYPQPTILAMPVIGDSKALAIEPGLHWEQMAQPKATDDELDLLDDDSRQRWADTVVAAYAGAYGV